MKIKTLILVLVVAVVFIASVVAMANGNVVLPRWVVCSGASNSADGDVIMHATLGQPVVGVISNGDITLSQGFWRKDGRSFIYLPLIQR